MISYQTPPSGGGGGLTDHNSYHYLLTWAPISYEEKNETRRKRGEEGMIDVDEISGGGSKKKQRECRSKKGKEKFTTSELS